MKKSEALLEILETIEQRNNRKDNINILQLRSVETAVDTDGGTYEMEREGNGWKIKEDLSRYICYNVDCEGLCLNCKRHLVDYYIQDTVVEWFDELDNYDLMKLTMWCIEHEISTPYNFR